jgi:glyoxylase-like metal-dependent hydrolase (beta-lactamase superfamily II)
MPALPRALVTLLLFVGLFGAACATAGDAPFKPWIDATHGPEPQMQVQRFDPDTYVVRQSILTNFEGPFIFLFFGQDRVLEIDTGAGGLEIRPTLDHLIEEWRTVHGLRSIQLVVAHSHSHRDHVAGDAEFASRPDTIVVGHTPEQVAAFFGVRHWPEDIAAFDLGGRVIDIIPSPGHEAAEITLFDERTRLLLTGDALYPGRLYIPTAQFDAYRRSVDRVVDFTRTRHVSFILGNHIVMTRTAGRDYAMHAPVHPREHPLELSYSSLLELQRALHAMDAGPRLEVHRDFIIYPLP